MLLFPVFLFFITPPTSVPCEFQEKLHNELKASLADEQVELAKGSAKVDVPGQSPGDGTWQWRSYFVFSPTVIFPIVPTCTLPVLTLIQCGLTICAVPGSPANSTIGTQSPSSSLLSPSMVALLSPELRAYTGPTDDRKAHMAFRKKQAEAIEELKKRQ